MKTKEPRTKMCTPHCGVVEASLQQLKCQNRHFESTSLRICRDDHLFRRVQSLVPLVVWIECSFPHASWAPWQLGGLVGPCLARTFAFSLPSLLRAPSCFALPPTHANPTSIAVLSSPCYAPPGLFLPKGGHTSLLPSPPFFDPNAPSPPPPRPTCFVRHDDKCDDICIRRRRTCTRRLESARASLVDVRGGARPACSHERWKPRQIATIVDVSGKKKKAKPETWRCTCCSKRRPAMPCSNR